MQSGRFSKGDRVELIRPFRRGGNASDPQIRVSLLEAYEGKPITGTVADLCGTEPYVNVVFDLQSKMRSYNYPLYVDEDVLALEVEPASDEEVDDAIRSIVRSLGR